jgi:hypothetical protein
MEVGHMDWPGHPRPKVGNDEGPGWNVVSVPLDVTGGSNPVALVNAVAGYKIVVDDIVCTPDANDSLGLIDGDNDGAGSSILVKPMPRSAKQDMHLTLRDGIKTRESKALLMTRSTSSNVSGILNYHLEPA